MPARRHHDPEARTDYTIGKSIEISRSHSLPKRSRRHGPTSCPQRTRSERARSRGRPTLAFTRSRREVSVRRDDCGSSGAGISTRWCRRPLIEGVVVRPATSRVGRGTWEKCALGVARTKVARNGGCRRLSRAVGPLLVGEDALGALVGTRECRYRPLQLTQRLGGAHRGRSRCIPLRSAGIRG
jgi:hypothetical protein